MRRFLLTALAAALVSACNLGAPTAPEPSTAPPSSTPSPAATATPAASSTPLPSATLETSPTPTVTSTPDPSALRFSPQTMGQLRVSWTIDEPGNPKAQSGCYDVACWMDTRIGSYAFSPDAGQLAVGVCLGDPTENVSNPRHYRYDCPAGSEVRLYEAATGALQESLAVGGFPISLAFHPDGNVLAVGMADRQIEVWDLASHKKIHQLDHSSKRTGVVSLTFSGDGTKLISEGDGTLQVWDWQTPLMLTRIDNATGVSLDPSGTRLATAWFGGTSASAYMARLYDLNNLPSFRELDLHSPVSFYQVQFAPDGTYVMAYAPGVVEFWDPTTETYLGKTNLQVLMDDPGLTFDASRTFTPDGFLLVQMQSLPKPPSDATPQPSDTGLDTFYCGFSLWNPRAKGAYGVPLSSEDCGSDASQYGFYSIRRVVMSANGMRLAVDDRGHLVVWSIDPTAPAVAPDCVGTCEP